MSTLCVLYLSQYIKPLLAAIYKHSFINLNSRPISPQFKVVLPTMSYTITLLTGLAVLIPTFLFAVTSGQLLTATHIANLPNQTRYPLLSYEPGDEWIYIFSETYEPGSSMVPYIRRLSTSNASLEVTVENPVDFSPYYNYAGRINSTSYLFGAGSNRGDILKLTHPSNISTESHFYIPSRSGAATYKNEIILIGSDIYKYSPELGTLEFVKDVPPPYVRANPSVVVIGDKAFVFGRPWNTEFEDKQSYFILDLINMEFFPGPADLNFLQFNTRPSVAYDGKFIYVVPIHIGDTTTEFEGFYQIDPETNTHQFIPVQNYPEEDALYVIDSPQAVYVEKMNGIFLVGGTSRTEDVLFNEMTSIWFVDLSPLSPTTPPPITTTSSTTLSPDYFSCSNHTDGFYPHPLDCAKFVGCHEGLTEYFECPEPLLFDPIIGTCNAPQLVECDISCVGKPDGLYPHPHGCDFFITCVSEELDVFQCPPPLLFDPVLRICNFPEQVAC